MEGYNEISEEADITTRDCSVEMVIGRKLIHTERRRN